MSAIDVHAQSLACLGQRDSVQACELLKLQTLQTLERLNTAIDGYNGGIGRDAVIETLAELGADDERWLAIALPLIEYGTPDDQRTVARMLSITAERTLAREDRGDGTVIADWSIGRRAWAAAAYALAADRIDGFAALSRSPIMRWAGESETAPLAQSQRLRHSLLLRDWRATVDQYLTWFGELPLRPKLALFDPILPGGHGDEADILLALVATNTKGGVTWTGRLHGRAVRRLGARLSDLEQRRALARALDVSEQDVADELDARYAGLVAAMRHELFRVHLPETISGAPPAP